MATLTVTKIAPTGITRTLAAVAGGGDDFVNTGQCWIEIENSSGSNAYTVTFVTGGKAKGFDIEDQDVAVAVSAKRIIGPFEPAVFNNAQGKVAMTYAGSAPATDLTIGVFSI